MSRINQCVYGAIAAVLLSGCSTGERSKGTVAVSIAPLASVVESICGDDYEVVTLLDQGSNPETFEPTMSKRAAVERSDVYLILDAFPYETKAAGERDGIIDVSKGIERLYGTHVHSNGDGHEHHHHGEADPHTWTSAHNMKLIARNIGEAMSEHNPEHAELYRAKTDSLVNVIDALDRRLGERLGNATHKAFAIWHPSLAYFAKDYGLKQIAVGEESKEVSPMRLKEIIERAQADSVKVFFYQKEFDSRQAYTINQHLGAKMVTIDPLASDWMGQLEMIADEIAGKH